VFLVLNCGSSSLKYRLIDLDDPKTKRGGAIERIGEPGGEAADHASALRKAADDLGLDPADITAVGHRVVHGGTRFREPILIDDDVIAAIRDLVPLAPLHNPANLTGIEVARELVPNVPHIAVFDTAFHSTLPEAAATYALDTDLAKRFGIRRYGFHGTSHRFVSRRTADPLNWPVEDLSVIVLHLGNGASASAVAGGRCVETSMGLSPLEGLVMGTRPGDLDPAITMHLHREGGLSNEEIDEVYQRRAGLTGLCGDNDMRRVVERREKGDPAATLAIDVYCHRIRKYVGAYHAVLGRLDAIAFTAGVGENAAEIRALALAGLGPMGIIVDQNRNTAKDRGPRVISPVWTKIAVCVVPTDEEYAIAEEAAELLSHK
jgi:acetate kinase